MTITEEHPVPAGAGPGSDPPKHAGTDDRCSWEEWDALRLKAQRCHKTGTDTVRGLLYCSPHADLAAGMV